jgi:hypothetical protein
MKPTSGSTLSIRVEEQDLPIVSAHYFLEKVLDRALH